MSKDGITMTFKVVDETGAAMRHVGDAITRFGRALRRGHRQPNGARCYIAHPLDKPCPKWRGRNYP